MILKRYHLKLLFANVVSRLSQDETVGPSEDPYEDEMPRLPPGLCE
jgi:hypothetical protein